VVSTSSLRSFEIAKGHSPPFNQKVFATRCARQRLSATPHREVVIAFRLHLSRKLSPLVE
jgi:hypothetical protein